MFKAENQNGNFVKHFNWVAQGEAGRIACAVNGDKFTMAQLAGKAPPQQVLYKLIGQLGGEFAELCNRANKSRINQFAVDVRYGMSGCVDYLLIERRDDSLCDYPIAARLHVSMYGKLNEKISLWIGDLPPLLSAAASGMASMADDVALEEAKMRNDLNFSAPDIDIYVSDSGSLNFATLAIDEDLSVFDQYLGPETLEKLAETTE